MCSMVFFRPLGQGAFGEVYEGKLSSGRVNVMPAKVAVKVRYVQVAKGMDPWMAFEALIEMYLWAYN